MNLSDREKEILLVSTLPYKEMSKRLYITVSTINTHVTNMLNRNPELINRHGILIKAIQEGLINPKDVITE